MQPRRILLTGGSGFVGTHLRQALGHAFPAAALHCPTTDITDAAAMAAWVQTLQPDACVHLAAIAGIPQARAEPALTWRVNLQGTLGLAQAILAHAPDCVFLFVSSADIYGQSFRAGVALDETALLAPLNTYAASKAAADLAMGALAIEGLRAIIVRPFNHTGPGQSSSFVVAAFAEQVARIGAGLQPPVLHVGALEPYRDFLDVRDVCAAYVACLQQAETLPPGIVLNLASGTPRRIGDVLADLQRLGGIEATIETASSRLRPSDIPTASGDTRLAHARLGWQPRIAWDQTLRDMLQDWHQRVRTP